MAPTTPTHPLGCHRRRIADRVIFDRLIQVLVLLFGRVCSTPTAWRVVHEVTADPVGGGVVVGAGEGP